MILRHILTLWYPQHSNLYDYRFIFSHIPNKVVDIRRIIKSSLEVGNIKCYFEVLTRGILVLKEIKYFIRIKDKKVLSKNSIYLFANSRKWDIVKFLNNIHLGSSDFLRYSPVKTYKYSKTTEKRTHMEPRICSLLGGVRHWEVKMYKYIVVADRNSVL